MYYKPLLYAFGARVNAGGFAQRGGGGTTSWFCKGRREVVRVITSETTVEPRRAMIVEDGTEVAQAKEKRRVC